MSRLDRYTRLFTDRRAARVLTQRVPNGPTWDVRPVGRESLTYAVYLDETRLHDLAVRAGGNKSGRAKSGPLVVSITGRRRDTGA